MMKNTPNLYDTVVHILGQHSHWLDKRHFYTLAWMIVSLIESQTIGLTAWTPFVDSRAPMPKAPCADFGVGWTTAALRFIACMDRLFRRH
jgi:hypothetical protein